MATTRQPVDELDRRPTVGAPVLRRSHAVACAAILAVAFVLRAAIRARLGADGVPIDGYRAFVEPARQIAANGFSLHGVDFGGRPPLYPLLLAALGLPSGSVAGVVIGQSLIGTATVAIAYLIARELFSTRAALLAALVTALYPYYVVHDTAVQETSTVTLLGAAATYLLLLAARGESLRLAFAAGALLAAGVLTRLTVAAFAGLALAWLALWSARPPRTRARLTLAAALPLVVAVGGWLAWNARSGSAAAVSGGIAEQFWRAHNPATFSAFPDSSIDLSARIGYRTLDSADVSSLLTARREPHALEGWYTSRAWHYIHAHPGRTAWDALRMLAIGFSWRLSPRASNAKELAYALTYLPVLLLAIVALVRTRHRWRELGPIYANVLGFAIVTAVFWAHTSHRVHLDVLLIVLAASVVDSALPRRAPVGAAAV